MTCRMIVFLILMCGVSAANGNEIWVSQFGGLPNDNIDDFGAIKMAIEAAKNSGFLDNEIRFESGDYLISRSIRIRLSRTPSEDALVPGSEQYGLLPSGVSLAFIGVDRNQTTIKVPINNHAANPMFVFDGVDYCGVEDLTLDGQVRSFGTNWNGKRPQCGVLLFGCQFSDILNVGFENLGQNDQLNTVDPIPGGANLIIASADEDEAMGGFLPDQILRGLIRDDADENETPDIPAQSILSPGLGRTSRKNDIIGCVFTDRDAGDNPIPCSNFAIRLMTNWLSTKFHVPGENQHAPLNARVKQNRILDCNFNGGYYWNAVELAGHATIDNTVADNQSNDCIQTPIEADKAASFNVFKKNKIYDTVSRSIVTQSARGDSSLGTWVFAMRMQGFRRFGDNEEYAERSAIGNEFIDNTIDGVFGNTRATGGILLSRTVDAVVKDNQINSLPQWKAETGQGYTSAEDAAAGIKLKNWVENTVFENNRVPRSKRPNGSRKSAFVNLMELPESRPAIVQLSDFPTDGSTLSGDERHLTFRIIEYLEKVNTQSLFTWTIETTASSSSPPIVE